MKNIIACVTPLQMLIAENLIEKIGGDFIVVVLTYDDNSKYQSYYERLKSKGAQVEYFHIKRDTKISRFFNILKFRLWLERRIKFKGFNICLVSSIENPFILAFLSNYKYLELRTFDDGIANINLNSVYYRTLYINWLERLAKYFSGIKKSRDDVKKESKIHYTIYPGYNNIIDNIEPINLLDSVKICETDDFFDKEIFKADTIKLFLGQPIKNIDEYLQKDSFDLFIKEEGIQYYFPHPREREKLIEIPSIDTDLIFEDFLAQLFKINPAIKIEVYTFFSGAALNVASYNNVRVIVLLNRLLEEKFKDSYKLLFESKYIEKAYF